MHIFWLAFSYLTIHALLGQCSDNLQQSIRHSRSKSKLFRANRHGNDHRGGDVNSELKLFVTSDEFRYSTGTSTTDHFKNNLENTINFEKSAPLALSQNYDSSNASVDVKGSSTRNNRKITVDSNFGPIVLSGTSTSQQELEITTAGSNGWLYGDEAEDSQLQHSFIESEGDEQVELVSFKTPTEATRTGHVDIVTRFLRIVESQHLLGENCTAGTDLNLGEGVVDRYAQERFRVEADVAVNRANMLTRIWKYADPNVVMSEYLLHASVFSMVEFDNDIFAAGNCYDQYQYKEYWLFCPYAYRLPEGPILVKDLAVEYKYLSNTSEWFYIARKNAEKVIKNYKQFSKGKCYEYLIYIKRVPNYIQLHSSGASRLHFVVVD